MRKTGLITAILVFLAFVVIPMAVSAQDEIDEVDEDLFAVIMGMIVICLVIFLLIAIALSVWIYKDANKRGKSGVVWAILMFLGTLLLFPIGTIIIAVIWLVVRGPEMGSVPPPGMPPQPYYPPQQPGYPPQQGQYPPPQQPPPY